MSKKFKQKRRLMKSIKKQMILSGDSNIIADSRGTGVTVAIELKSPIYYCPFCLYYGRIEQFEYRTPKGNVSKGVKCPECDNKMLRRSLTTPMNAEQYAEWVYNYRLSGFWRKVNFSKWKERLYKLGLAYKFWMRYRELKGDMAVTESEEEQWQRYQKEQSSGQAHV